MLRHLLGLVFSMLVATPHAALAQVTVGYVASVEGDPSEPKLLRNSDSGRRLRLGENILLGDTITTPPSVKVRIDTRSGMLDPCHPEPTSGICRLHFQSEAGGIPGAAIANRIAAMLSWYATPARNLTTRSASPPTIYVGKGKTQKLAAGNRPLRVGWEDGVPPFSVSVLNAGRVVASSRSSEQDIRLPAANYKVGAGQIVIEDAKGQRATMQLVFVGEKPVLPDLTAYAVNAQHRALLELGTIAASDQGAWLFEALQEIDTLGSSDLARVFERALLSGGQP